MKLFVGAKAVLEHKGKVLLVRESADYLDGTEIGKWDMVGGRINPEEEVREGLMREVKEESGLDVKAGKLMGVFDGFMNIRGEDCHVVRIYFHCTTEKDKVHLSTDHSEYEWVDPNNYGDKILMNDIKEMLAEAGKLLK